MNQNASSTREIIEQIVKQSGITKKLATSILHAIPDIIEEGLKKDSEVRVKGLGTFRLRWTRGKIGRNPKTGERVDIPSHNRVVFLPEKAFKEYINRDNRLLGYRIIPPAEKAPSIEEIIPEPGLIEPYQDHEQYQPQPLSEAKSESIPEPEPEIVIAPEIEIETEPEPPIRKRRIHWIIPVAISVVIILSLVFYFRNFYHPSRQSSVVSRQSAVGSQQSAVSSQQSAVSGQQSAVSSQQSAVSGQQSIKTTQKSEISNPKSELNTQHSTLKTIPSGTRLFKLAREAYGNPYLWVLIYKENQDKISDPDMVISGRELIIPVLEGKPDRLSRNDSLAVSEGYRLVYEYFNAKNDPRTNDFFRAIKRYKPL